MTSSDYKSNQAMFAASKLKPAYASSYVSDLVRVQEVQELN